MFNLFFRNRRLLVLCIGLILVAGSSSMFMLPRMEDPELTPRAGLVNTIFPGANSEHVESLVTETLEEKLLEVEEIKEIKSTSRSGVSTISIELRDDVYEAEPIWSQIRDKLADAEGMLPAGCQRPQFEDVEVRAFARIVAVRWDRDDEPNYAILVRLAEALEDRMEQISGTDDVKLFGVPSEEYLVTVDHDRMVALGLTVDRIANQLRASDAKVSAGQLRGSESDYLVEVDSELDSQRRLERTPIRYGNIGQVVQVADIAEITKGIVDPATELSLVSGKPAVVLGAFVRSSNRIDLWNDNVEQVLNGFQDELPSGVSIANIFEQNSYVKSRLSGLVSNLFMGAIAVFAVIFFAMGWRNAIAIGLALPLSALMVLTGMRFLEIPIHQMSISGLILALGLLIDNAIVIVDEVSRRMENGESAAQSVSNSVRHLGIPLFGATLTTALAFAPIALMEGPAGEFVGSISISVILAIVSSFFLAMTVTPAIGAIIGSWNRNPDENHFWDVGLQSAWLANAYHVLLRFVLNRPVVGLVFGIALPITGFVVSQQLPEQFFPGADRDQFFVEVELPPTASIRDTQRMVEQVRTEMLKESRVRDVHWFLGQSGPTFYYNVISRYRNRPFYAQGLIQIDSAVKIRELVRKLQNDLDGKFPDARLLVRQLEQGPPFDAPIEVRLFGPDLKRLGSLTEQLRTELALTKNVIHLKSEMAESLPKIALAVDEEQARLAGLDHAQVSGQLDSLLEGSIGGSILESTEELPVRVRTSNATRADWSSVASFNLLPNQPNATHLYPGVPLTSIASMNLKPESSAITRLNGQRMSEIEAFISAGVLPATVLDQFRNRIESSEFQLPPGYQLSFGGETAKRNEAIGALMANVGILLTCMVATLVLSFGSFRIAAIIVIVATLSAGLGVGAIWLFGYPFGFMAIIGSMGLMGVAINDAIVVLAAIRGDHQAAAGDLTAINHVVRGTTRHVVSTSLTTMAGFAPLILAGGMFWPPLAVAIGGGVVGATILALIFVPSLYVILMCRKNACRIHSDNKPNHETVDEQNPSNTADVDLVKLAL